MPRRFSTDLIKHLKHSRGGQIVSDDHFCCCSLSFTVPYIFPLTYENVKVALNYSLLQIYTVLENH